MTENFTSTVDANSREATRTASPSADIEADWILMRSCNFRCHYCFWDPEDLGQKISTVAPVEQLASFFETTGLTWLLHLTGGEPLIYPNFMELCRLLTRSNWISMNTNADNALRIEAFIDHVDPARVQYINAGLHIEERDRRKRVDAFLEHVSLLRRSGFAVFATSVMHPQVFARFEELWAYCAQRGVFLIPKAFQGSRRGRRYPESYTHQERELFRVYSARAADACAGLFSLMASPPTVDPLLDAEKFLEGLPDHRGATCNAGRTFVRIREDGEIRRCGPGDVLGNVVKGTFNRRAGPGTCVWRECPYFCEKHLVRSADDPHSTMPTGLPLM